MKKASMRRCFFHEIPKASGIGTKCDIRMNIM